MDISHDHTGFWPQIPFLGSKGLFSPFWPPKVCFFLLHVKFPIDGYITRPYWFWAPNSVFGLCEPIFSFLTPGSTYYLHLYTNSDRLMGQMTYFIFGPHSVQPRDPADSNFFWAKNTLHHITKYSTFLDFWDFALFIQELLGYNDINF
jgi:hypothetical protein